MEQWQLKKRLRDIKIDVKELNCKIRYDNKTIHENRRLKTLSEYEFQKTISETKKLFEARQNDILTLITDLGMPSL